MNDHIEERVLEVARYIAVSGATVRQAARIFGVSKSTVHKDITHKLKNINPALYKDVQRVLMKNKAERHLRGGMATHRKYKGESA